MNQWGFVARHLRLSLSLMLLGVNGAFASLGSPGDAPTALAEDVDAPAATTILPVTTGIPVQSNDLAYDPITERLYVSVPTTDPLYANSIVIINPQTRLIEGAIPVGTEPNKLAIADDGSYLYVGLDGEQAIRRVNLATRAADLTTSLGSSGCPDPLWASDMAVQPGNPDTVAILIGCRNALRSSVGIAIYRNGVIEPDTVAQGGAQALSFAETPTVLYSMEALDSSDDGFSQLSVITTGVVISRPASSLGDLGVDFTYRDGLAYTTSGKVVDPATPAVVGAYPEPGYYFPFPVALTTYAHWFGSHQLDLYNFTTRQILTSYTIPRLPDDPFHQWSLIEPEPIQKGFFAFREYYYGLQQTRNVVLYQLFENQPRLYLPILNRGHQTLTYPIINRCAQYPLTFSGQVKARITMCVTSVQVLLGGALVFHVQWSAEFLTTDLPAVCKNSDQNNRAMYLTGSLGNRYDHTAVGGAAANAVCIYASSPAPLVGWFQFPRAASGETIFAFHDDDQSIIISDILVPNTP